MEDGSNWGVGGTKYLRHRQHQTVKQPTNRHYVDHVCNWVLEFAKKGFRKDPSVNHIYFSAYAVIFGTDAANKMLSEARDGK